MSAISNISQGIQSSSNSDIAGLTKEISNLLDSRKSDLGFENKPNLINQDQKIDIALIAKKEFSGLGKNVHEMV